jgi:hypothetical protein
MPYQETGTLTYIGEPQNIGDKYRKLLFVITNASGYEGADKSFAMEIFEKADGEKIEKFLKYNNLGKAVDIDFEIRCNENPKKPGQWFTSLSAFKIFTAADEDEGVQESPAEQSSEEIPF